MWRELGNSLLICACEGRLSMQRIVISLGALKKQDNAVKKQQDNGSIS